MKKTFIVLAMILLSLTLSCSNNVEETVPDNVQKQAISKTIMTQINELGDVNKVYYSGKTKATRSIKIDPDYQPEVVEKDGQLLDRYHFLIEYNKLDGSIIEYLKSLTSIATDKKLEDSFQYNLDENKLYIEFNFYFFHDTLNQAYIEVNLYDDLGFSTSCKATDFSKDFLYDIINQIKLHDGKYIGYDWIAQDECEPDHYQLIDTPSPFLGTPEQVWERTDRYNKPVVNDYILRSWIGEYSKDDKAIKELTEFKTRKFKVGKNLTINGFNYEKADVNKIYTRIDRYPYGFKSAYWLKYYIYENNMWYAANGFFTDADFHIKHWKHIEQTETNFAELKDNLEKNIGKIASVYQEYVGDQPVQKAWNHDIKGNYIVNFATMNNPDAIQNAARRFNSSYMEYDFAETFENPLSITLEYGYYNHIWLMLSFYKDIEDGTGKPAFSDNYLSASPDFSIINGINMVNGKISNGWNSLGPDKGVFETISTGYPTYGTPTKVWKKFTTEGLDYQTDQFKASYIYELPVSDEAISQINTLETFEENDLSLDGYGYDSAAKDKYYVMINVSQDDYFPYAIMQFAYYNTEKSKWIISNTQEANEKFETAHWISCDNPKEGSRLYDVKTQLEKIGTINAIYQKYYGDTPVTQNSNDKLHGFYIIEFKKINDPSILWSAMQTPHMKHIGKPGGTEAAPIKNDTVAIFKIMDIINRKPRTNIYMESINTDDNSWYHTFAWVPCSRDFKEINGIIMETGESLEDWTSFSDNDSKFTKIDYPVLPNNMKPKTTWKKTGTYVKNDIYICEFPYDEATKQETINQFRAAKEIAVNSALSVQDFTNRTASRDSYYVEANCISYGSYTYELKFYWFEDNKWNNTVYTYADKDLNIMYWGEPKLFTEAQKFMEAMEKYYGKIVGMHQAYININGQEFDKTDGYRRYVFEFEDKNPNVFAALNILGDSFRLQRDTVGWAFGPLQKGVSSAIDVKYRDDGSLMGRLLIKEERSGNWVTTMYEHRISSDFRYIGNFDLQTGDIADIWTSRWNADILQRIENPDQSVTMPYSRLWCHEKSEYTGKFYIAEFKNLTENQLKFFKDRLDRREGNELYIRGFSNKRTNADNVYLCIEDLKKGNPNRPKKYSINCFWYDGEAWNCSNYILYYQNDGVFEFWTKTASLDPKIPLNAKISNLGNVICSYTHNMGEEVKPDMIYELNKLNISEEDLRNIIINTKGYQEDNFSYTEAARINAATRIVFEYLEPKGNDTYYGRIKVRSSKEPDKPGWLRLYARFQFKDNELIINNEQHLSLNK